MRQLKIRFARPDEAEQIVDWLHKNQEANQFSPAILKDPSMRVLCTYDENGPVAYIPLVRVYMLESFAPKPGIDRSDAAQSLRDFTKAALLLASAEHISSIYFLDGSNGVAEMAQTNHYELVGRRNGNGEIEPYRVLRIKSEISEKS